MDFVTLKDGTVVLSGAVTSTLLQLEKISLVPGFLFELVEKCRDGHYQLKGRWLEGLQRANLVLGDGSIQDVTRDIVLNAVEGEELDMRLVNPIMDK